MKSKMHQTGFFWDEQCFWHSGGNYALTLPVGGLVQPATAGGFPDSPETKRRLKNLMDVTGLSQELALFGAEPASWDDLARVHPESYLNSFKKLSDDGGGEIGPRAPFSQGGFEIAALSAGLAKTAIFSVLQADIRNAYALCRPPGHHCLPDMPNGFCLLANISIAVEAALVNALTDRVAIVDWDVHHGNGSEAIFYDRDDVLTISLHQDRNYPMDTGAFEDRGVGAGLGCNLNIPLPPGGGHKLYIEAMERLVQPALEQFRPDIIIVACGFDASAVDPLGRMMATAETFKIMTHMMMETAADLCDDRLVLVHEGGYNETYVPFCGHATLEALSGSAVQAPDPLAQTLEARQPSGQLVDMHSNLIDEMVAQLDL
ncbi:MAG: class II histone deacetylase [Pseudomonadota bacterium]